MQKLYDLLLDGMPDDVFVRDVEEQGVWTLASTENGGLGIAMTTAGETRPRSLPRGFRALSLRRAAESVLSWNLREASAGMAVINAFYNSPERLQALNALRPQKEPCAAGLNLCGAVVGVVGHLRLPKDMLLRAREVCILERAPREGDYPDSACEYILPRCSVVLISGSAFINKTMPRLLELSRGADVVILGPSTPMAPQLLELGVRRLTGLVLTDEEGIRRHARGAGGGGSPYRFGLPYTLDRPC